MSSSRLCGNWQSEIIIEWAADHNGAPCIARCREEAALDEAVMPADAFAQKQAMMHRLQEQQEAFKVHMKCSTQRMKVHEVQAGPKPWPREQTSRLWYAF